MTRVCQSYQKEVRNIISTCTCMTMKACIPTILYYRDYWKHSSLCETSLLDYSLRIVWWYLTAHAWASLVTVYALFDGILMRMLQPLWLQFTHCLMACLMRMLEPLWLQFTHCLMACLMHMLEPLWLQFAHCLMACLVLMLRVSANSVVGEERCVMGSLRDFNAICYEN